MVREASVVPASVAEVARLQLGRKGGVLQAVFNL